MSGEYKYPKTWHCPESKPNPHGNDRVHNSLEFFAGREVVCSLKMDGENATLGRDYYHARSLDSGSHPSRTWIKAFHATFAHRIPDGVRICGENLQAKHSIEYHDLPSYFFVFGIYNSANVCLSWDDMVAMCRDLGLLHVPVLYRGIWNEAAVKACYTARTIIGGVDCGEAEGYVVRLSEAFAYDDFWKSTYKFVRPNFVPGDTEHWSKTDYKPNGLRR